MTTITGNYSSLAALLGQAANRQATTTNAGTGNSGTAAAATSSSAGSTDSKSLKDVIAAAANSAQYDFATVGKNARTVLDAGISAYGQTPGTQTTEQQWIKIFGGMDRRSLYAVASNQGGQFSAQEQKIAKSLMDNQVANAGNASGSGTTSQQVAGYQAKVNYLNTVSPEEKQSAAWAYSMADAQTSARMADIDSRMPQSSGGNGSLVNVLMGAMYNVRSQSSSPVSFGSVNSLSDITSQSWAQSYASQIESAFASSYQPGSSYSVSI